MVELVQLTSIIGNFIKVINKEVMMIVIYLLMAIMFIEVKIMTITNMVAVE